MKLLSRKASATNEELFIERYGRLLRWSLQLTEQDYELAEDLLHDAFIQFTLSATDIESIHNLDGYLYGMLRNLHLSQLRRTTRHRFEQLSIVEYESALVGLRSVDPRTQIQVQQELRQICQYACARKEISKAGSVLILRFFHGYYPSEIVKILQSTRKAVDDRLRLARAEAKAALDSPESLAFMGARILPEVLPMRFARNHDDFLEELRQTIFTARKHECLSIQRLDEFYGRRARTSPTPEHLGHLVSCPECLDRVNKRLNLPLLAERFAPDTLGNEPRSKDGPGGGGDGGATGGEVRQSVRKWKRDARETFEHKPQELCISVNGYLQGSQKVASELSEQSLTVDLNEEISFVEVFSEQGIRLLLMNVSDSPPEGPGEQTLRVPLSDRRTLDLALRFSSPWPTLNVCYRDPALATQPGTEPLATGVNEELLSLGDLSLSKNPRSFWLSLKRRMMTMRPGSFDFGLLLRPGIITAVFSVLLVIALLVVQLRRPVASLSAADLLTRAAAAEGAQLARMDQVLHRTISLEEKSSTGALIARHRIEIWQSGERGITARRLYDERGALVSGDWRRSDGVQTLYHHGTRPQLQLAPEKRGEAAIRFDTVWHLGLMAREFSLLVGNVQSAHVQDTAANYVINYVSEAAKTSGIVRVRLVLSRADLHAIEQMLVVQQEGQAREYRFVETSFERRPPDSVAPAVFEPDAELLSLATTEIRHAPATVSPSIGPLPPAAVLATAALELEVLRLLNQAGADLGEQIDVTRARDGKLNVHGVIETAQRKQEILAALRPVTGNPAVRIDIDTVAEALRKQAPGSQRPTEVTVEDVQTSTVNVIPVDAELRRYLSARGTSHSQLEDEVRRFANQIVSQSRQAMYHAAAMKRLAERFSPDEVRSLDDDARTKWLSLIRKHARSFQSDSTALRQELAPVFSSAVVVGSEPGDISDTDALVRAVTHLFEVSAVNYNAIQTAFTLSNKAPASSALKSPQFWRAMREAETLAGKIANHN